MFDSLQMIKVSNGEGCRKSCKASSSIWISLPFFCFFKHDHNIHIYAALHEDLHNCTCSYAWSLCSYYLWKCMFLCMWKCMLLLLLFTCYLELLICLICILFICLLLLFTCYMELLHLLLLLLISFCCCSMLAAFLFNCCCSPFVAAICLLYTSSVFTIDVILGCDDLLFKFFIYYCGIWNQVGNVFMTVVEVSCLIGTPSRVGWLDVNQSWLKPLHTLLVGNHSNWEPCRSISFSFLEIHLHEWYYESFFNMIWALRI